MTPAARTSGPRPRRRVGGRSARVRAAVLTATVDALLADGIDGFSIAGVAARAGVHETSIYRRWGTRAALALDAITSHQQVELPIPDTGSLRGDLLGLLRNLAAFLTTPLGEALLQLAGRDDLPEYDAAREAFWSARFALASAMLERADARGELRPDLDYRITLETLVAPVHLRLRLTRQPADDAFLARIVDVVLRGICAAPQPRTPAAARRQNEPMRSP